MVWNTELYPLGRVVAVLILTRRAHPGLRQMARWAFIREHDVQEVLFLWVHALFVS